MNGDRTNDVFKFVFSSSEWCRIKTNGKKPCARAGHSAVIVESYMYIFGGKDNSDTMLNDMWRLNLSVSSADWEKVAYDTESVTPRGRQGHTMAFYKNHIIVFGGLYEITRELNDLHIFNLKSG